jgi:hypothetical protein
MPRFERPEQRDPSRRKTRMVLASCRCCPYVSGQEQTGERRLDDSVRRGGLVVGTQGPASARPARHAGTPAGNRSARARAGSWALRAALIATITVGLAVAPAFSASIVHLYGQSNFEKSKQGAEQTVRIDVSPADGVTTLDLYFQYDPTVITPTAVYRTAFTNDFTLSYYLGIPGMVELHLSGSTALAGTDDVAWIAFHVIGSEGSVAALTWDSAILNGGVIASTTQIVKDITVGSSDVTFSVPDDIQTTPSSTVMVNVSATQFTFTNGIDLRLRYNPSVALVTNVAKTTLTNPFTLLWNNVSPGVLQMQFSGTADPSGSGPVASLTFNIVGGVGSSTPLNLDLTRTGGVVKFADDGSLSVCPASCDDGNLCTTDSCVLGQCVHVPVAMTTVCRPSAGPCDVAETCDATGRRRNGGHGLPRSGRRVRRPRNVQRHEHKLPARHDRDCRDGVPIRGRSLRRARDLRREQSRLSVGRIRRRIDGLPAVRRRLRPRGGLQRIQRRVSGGRFRRVDHGVPPGGGLMRRVGELHGLRPGLSRRCPAAGDDDLQGVGGFMRRTRELLRIERLMPRGWLRGRRFALRRLVERPMRRSRHV